VRQDFLLDTAELQKGEVNYRNGWIQNRLLLLSDVFAIDLLSFAIMDNHTHLVLFANKDLAKQWSNIEVLKRWSKLGKLPLLCQLYLNKDWRSKLNEIELLIVLEQIDGFRSKLADISAFMSRFNYYIAKRANKEDKVSGHFWEARFKSQALLSMDAVIACMAYVDLNPVRAKKSLTLHDSSYTSINYRLQKAKDQKQARVMALKTQTTLDCQTDLLGLSLHTYTAYLNGLIAPTNSAKKFDAFSAFTSSNEYWQKNAISFEDSFSISAGENELVSLFNKQARLFSNIRQCEITALGDTILSRLRDSRYLFGKKRLCN